MKEKQSQQPTLNAAELQLVEQLRQYPELFDRVRSILEISASAAGQVKELIAVAPDPAKETKQEPKK